MQGDVLRLTTVVQFMQYPYEDIYTAANDAGGSGSNQEGMPVRLVRSDIRKLVFIEGFLLFSIDF